MKQFEIGKSYTMRSLGDRGCTWTYTIINRTAQTITITDGKEIRKCKVSKRASEVFGCEVVYPTGQYSMCPALKAE